MSNTQWLCLMPHPYGWGDNQGRDIGALANGLRQLGERVDFFVLDDRTDVNDPQVQLANTIQLSDPRWWATRGQGVFLTTFGTTRMQPFYRAAKQAGWMVWTRLDCDGVPGPDGGAAKYIKGRVIEGVDRNRRSKRDFSGSFSGFTKGFFLGCAGVLLRSLVRKRLGESFKLADLHLVETPLARESLRIYFQRIYPEISPDRLVLMPPAISEAFSLPPNLKKTSTVLAVGQWWRMQKHPRLLHSTICKTLAANERIQWTVAGDGARLVEDHIRSKQPGMCTRISFHDHLSPSDLRILYAKSQIAFYSSLQEGFPNTLCEALCSGTTFVAPKGIQAFDHCANLGWGNTYSQGHAAEVLLAEIDLWRSGGRVSYANQAIQAQSLFHRKNVAQMLVNLRWDAPPDTCPAHSLYCQPTSSE